MRSAPFATHNLLNVVMVVLFAMSGVEEQWKECQKFCFEQIMEEFKRQPATLILLAELMLDVFYNGGFERVV